METKTYPQDVENAKPEMQNMEDPEAQKIKKPEYLDDAFLNVRACLPWVIFKRHPCIHCSCFSAIFACVVACFLGCFLCFRDCGLRCCKCGLDCGKCGCGLFLKCYKCLLCPFQFCLKKCAPCLQCLLCPVKCIFGCLLKLNCCNIECGLPCFSPPGCVCIFPCKLCGFGLTCPSFPVSCGTKHCFKMPKEEQNYWYSLESAPEPLTMKKYQKETPDVQALENEIARLRKEVEELRATQAPKAIAEVVVEK